MMAVHQNVHFMVSPSCHVDGQPVLSFTMLCVLLPLEKILGFYISVVNSSRLNVLKEGWDSVSPQSHELNLV